MQNAKAVDPMMLVFQVDTILLRNDKIMTFMILKKPIPNYLKLINCYQESLEDIFVKIF